MTKDVILLTVDSWRYDTTHLVPKLNSQISGQSEAICAGAATNWVFPSILSGTHYPNAYKESGGIHSNLVSLPQILSDGGFSTGGFVACNPYVSKWSDHFDEFWNGRLSDDSTDWYSSDIEKWLSRGYRTALLKKRVSAREIAERASEWYTQQEGPRFLWMHLMEPHLPYYPGLRRALDVGLMKSYKSVINYQRHYNDTPAEDMGIQRELYDQCIELFDQHVPELLNFVDDDAIIVSLGDHGEEFNHGHYDHERLYDECVRVPLFFENISGLSGADPVRQIDLAPTILNELGFKIPTEWDGRESTSLNDHPATMLTPQPDEDLLHVGIRTANRKLIKSYARTNGELISTELYDINADPEEKHDIYNQRKAPKLEEQLDDFLAEHEPALEIDATTGIESSIVESRLENLGYK